MNYRDIKSLSSLYVLLSGFFSILLAYFVHLFEVNFFVILPFHKHTEIKEVFELSIQICKPSIPNYFSLLTIIVLDLFIAISMRIQLNIHLVYVNNQIHLKRIYNIY